MEHKQINVKIRNDLVDKIKSQSKTNLRTMQAELEKILDEYFLLKSKQEERPK